MMRVYTIVNNIIGENDIMIYYDRTMQETGVISERTDT
jgi:hypothetical protein